MSYLVVATTLDPASIPDPPPPCDHEGTGRDIDRRSTLLPRGELIEIKCRACGAKVFAASIVHPRRA